MIAEITRYLKNNPKGVNEMCKQMEELRKQSAMEKAKEMALNMYAEGDMVERIARIAGVSVSQVKSWIAEGQ